MAGSVRLDEAKKVAAEWMSMTYPCRKWYIAGGCLRDTDLGRDFKDVDIFVSGFETDPEPVDLDGLLADPGDRNAYLMRAEVVSFKGFDLNIIFMRTTWTLEGIADRCDFGICQISWCPEEDRTYRSDAYLWDKERRFATNTRATVPTRFERMADKGFKVRNPRNLPVATGGWHYVNGQVVRN